MISKSKIKGKLNTKMGMTKYEKNEINGNKSRAPSKKDIKMRANPY